MMEQTKNLNPVARVTANDDGKTKVHWYENSVLEGLEPGQSVELVVGVVGAPVSLLYPGLPRFVTHLSENVNGKFRVIEEDQKVDNPTTWSPPFPVYRSPVPSLNAASNEMGADEIKLLRQTAADFEGAGETSTSLEQLMKWASLGLLECTHFAVTAAGKEVIEANGGVSK